MESNNPPKDLNDFIEKYKAISEKGFIKTHRAGNTGVGKTLEDELGIKENDIQGPDFGEYELKAHRINKSNSMLSLITKKPEGVASNKKLLDVFGYETIEGNKELHTTLKYGNEIYPKGCKHSISLLFSEKKLFITCDGEPMKDVFWNLESIRNAISNKYASGKIVFAGAESRGSGEDEEFWYAEAIEAEGINYEKIIELIKEGKIVVDIRLGTYKLGVNKGKLHDHGTGFRIALNNQPYLFEDVKKIVSEYKSKTLKDNHK